MKTLDTTYTSNPTPQNGGLSADEYTAFLQEDRRERTLRNITRRAENLWDDGYLMEPGGLAGLYLVRPPAKDDALIPAAYQVTHIPGNVVDDHCTCPCFAKLGTCKHLQAVKARVAELARQAEEDARADAEWERAEEVRTFFDSAREYNEF